MKSMYSIPFSILSILILILVAAFIFSILLLTLVIKSDKLRGNVLFVIFCSALIVDTVIPLEMAASVGRHFAEGIIIFDFNNIFRYFIIIPMIISILFAIMNKKYYEIIFPLFLIPLFPFFDNLFKEYYIIYFIAISLFISSRNILLFWHNIRKYGSRINQFSIKETLDGLPLGIIMTDYEKRIIFINETMNKILNYNNISSRIKTDLIWKEIKSKDNVFLNANLSLLNYQDRYYMFSFDKVINTNGEYYQIKCSDITGEYNILEEIKEKNEHLKEQGEEISQYISKLEDIEREKSLLRIKSKVHDVLAQRLSIIHQFLDNNSNIIKIDELKKLIEEMFDDITSNDIEADSMIEGIIASFGMIGMQIIFDGDFSNIKEINSVLKIIREAATNALRHGQATKLFVSKKDLKIVITNNGIEPTELKLGNGLKGMKFIAEESGFNLDIYKNSFRIVITL